MRAPIIHFRASFRQPEGAQRKRRVRRLSDYKNEVSDGNDSSTKNLKERRL
jgi:hypothetical protein